MINITIKVEGPELEGSLDTEDQGNFDDNRALDNILEFLNNTIRETVGYRVSTWRYSFGSAVIVLKRHDEFKRPKL